MRMLGGLLVAGACSVAASACIDRLDTDPMFATDAGHFDAPIADARGDVAADAPEDAHSADAAPGDAAHDAGGGDAGVDASPQDGAVGIDAAPPPDASLFDAPPPDANVPDAPDFDAFIPDAFVPPPQDAFVPPPQDVFVPDATLAD